MFAETQQQQEWTSHGRERLASHCWHWLVTRREAWRELAILHEAWQEQATAPVPGSDWALDLHVLEVAMAMSDW